MALRAAESQIIHPTTGGRVNEWRDALCWSLPPVVAESIEDGHQRMLVSGWEPDHGAALGIRS
ncbi:MAG: hypothetical protein D6723_07725 [Acidobacteria bacterium]|nr:MAG: hypothetical protein D6723_07725 [Acidobacteriota bacterium]